MKRVADIAARKTADRFQDADRHWGENGLRSLDKFRGRSEFGRANELQGAGGLQYGSPFRNLNWFRAIVRRSKAYLTGGFRATGLTASFAITAAIFLTGCISHTQTYVTDVDAREWRTPAVLNIPSADTMMLRDMYVFVRSNDNFSVDTLTLQLTFFTPDSLCYKERLFVIRGQNRRSPSMAQETRILYRTHIRLRQEGTYRVHLTPSVPVAGIEAVGIQIAKRY